MKEKNVSYLKDQIKYTGFGEQLSDQLSEKIEQQLETFTLEYQKSYGQSSMEVELYFSKSLTQDMYFFNAYVVNLKGPAGRMTQTFYIRKGNNITLKEAYNLMSGRAVRKVFKNKDGKNFTSWVQLDPFTTTPNGNYKMVYYHDNYGYNLELTLSKYPILEMGLEEFKDSIINSLEKGNMQMVTFAIDGKEEIRFIAANPKFKSITIYNESMEKQFYPTESSKIKEVAEEARYQEEKTQKTDHTKKKMEVLTSQEKTVSKNPLHPSESQHGKRKKRPRITREM